MALKATIIKAVLHVADMDRGYYQDHPLTIAQHPSETDERLMVRLLAFGLHAHPDLAFTKGLSTDDEPDLWQRDPGGDIELWIDLGQPDERRIRRACGRARRVLVYCYSGHGAEIWWRKARDSLAGLDNLTVVNLPPPAAAELGKLAARSLDLQCTIQEGQIWFGTSDGMVTIVPQLWQGE